MSILMSEAPRVAAIVVAHEPGEYFEECLRSIDASNYPNLRTIVIDTSPDRRVAETTHRVLPGAIYHRLEQDPGYSQSANIGAEFDSEASHLLFLHDDVALYPEAISSMMEVAFSKNAGIVTPKYLVWDSPSQILQLGLMLDKTAAAASRVDVGDLDQSQYDGVEEVPVAPGGAMLVRADLFRAIDGFDPAVKLFGEDIDLSCRAHVVGAKVYTAPHARVRHKMVATLLPPKHRERRRSLRKAVVGRGGADHLHRIRYSRRHQLRTILKDFVGKGRKRAIIRFSILSIVESIYYLLSGRPRLALAVLAAFEWNFARRKDVRSRRRSLKAIAAPNAAPIQLLGGSARISAYFQARRSLKRILRQHAESSDEAAQLVDEESRHPRVEDVRVEGVLARLSKVTLWIVALGMAYSLFSVIFGALPLLGSFSQLPSSGALLSSYFHGTYSTSQFGAGIAPTAYLLFGLLSLLTLGDGGVFTHVMIAASIVMGAWGTYSLTRRSGSAMAARFATSTYLLLPTLAQAFQAANLTAILGFGLTPWLLVAFNRAVDAQRASRRSMRRANLGLGLVTAVVFAVSPSLAVSFLGFVGLGALFGVLRRSYGSARRWLVSGAVAAVAALVIDLPWSASLFDPSVGVSRVFGGLAPAGISFLHLLGFSTTPGYSPPLVSYGVLLFAVVGLWLAKGRRITAVGSALLGYGVFILFSSISASGVLGGSPLPIWSTLAYAAVLLALATGLVFDAIVTDLPRFKLGLRHLLGFIGGIAFVVSSLTFIKGFTTSRLGLPASGFEGSLSFVGSLPPRSSVLWLGDPSVMPVQGWKLANGLSVALVSQVPPDYRSQFAPTSYGAAAPIVHALSSAIAGDNVELGKVLAKAGVKYVLVPQPTAAPGFFVGTDLDLIFERQVDLQQLLVDPSVVAFQVKERIQPAVAHQSTLVQVLRYGGIAVELVGLGLVLSALVRRRALLIRLRVRDIVGGRSGSQPERDRVQIPDPFEATGGQVEEPVTSAAELTPGSVATLTKSKTKRRTTQADTSKGGDDD
jgi:GT2 family glycosyltransferase